MMKKIVSIILCAILLFGISGCGSKKLSDPDEIYAKLKEMNTEFDLKYEKQYDYYSLDMKVKGYLIDYTIYLDDSKASAIIYFVAENMKRNVMVLQENGEQTLTGSTENCIYMPDEPEGNDCSETGISDAKDEIANVDELLDEIGTDHEGMIKFSEWYIEQEK